MGIHSRELKKKKTPMVCIIAIQLFTGNRKNTILIGALPQDVKKSIYKQLLKSEEMLDPRFSVLLLPVGTL